MSGYINDIQEKSLYDYINEIKIKELMDDFIATTVLILLAILWILSTILMSYYEYSRWYN